MYILMNTYILMVQSGHKFIVITACHENCMYIINMRWIYDFVRTWDILYALMYLLS